MGDGPPGLGIGRAGLAVLHEFHPLQQPEAADVADDLVPVLQPVQPGRQDFAHFESARVEVFLGQHGADAGDSLNFARRWTRQPFPDYPARRVLMQEGLDDALVFNVLSEELAMVAGLATGEAAESAAGVSAHWIFPGGHGIFERPDVQVQAGTYLASGGTRIVAPATP